MRLTRRTDTRPAISANTIPAPAAMSTTTGLVQAWGEGGSSWCAARPRSPQFASHRPGRYAARPATAPSTASSSQIMRRTWPGVAPTARSRARLRQRRAIDSAMVPATTKNAMASTATPQNFASCSRSSLSVPTARSSAWPVFPGPSTVRSEPPSAAWTRPARVAADTPGRATMPIRSACPGWPYSAAASASERNTVQSPAGLAPLAAATPTTVNGGKVLARQPDGGPDAQPRRGGHARAEDDLAGCDWRMSAGQAERGERGTGPAMCLERLGRRTGGNGPAGRLQGHRDRDVGNGGRHAIDRSQTIGQAQWHAPVVRQRQHVGLHVVPGSRGHPDVRVAGHHQCRAGQALGGGGQRDPGPDKDRGRGDEQRSHRERDEGTDERGGTAAKRRQELTHDPRPPLHPGGADRRPARPGRATP